MIHTESQPCAAKGISRKVNYKGTLWFTNKKVMMKLFLISQEQNPNFFDAFDSAVIAAPGEETARHMSPSNGKLIENWSECSEWWCSDPKYVIVQYIGEAAADVEQGVICSSFSPG